MRTKQKMAIATKTASKMSRCVQIFAMRLLPVLFFVLWLTGASHAQQKLRSKVNIIFILADDLGYGDLSCYGQKHFKTTHIDRLAAEGMRFTNHYSGSPVCAPSRSALMTGLH